MSFFRSLVFSWLVFLRLNSSKYDTTSWMANDYIFFKSEKEGVK